MINKNSKLMWWLCFTSDEGLTVPPFQSCSRARNPKRAGGVSNNDNFDLRLAKGSFNEPHNDTRDHSMITSSRTVWNYYHLFT
jgi:hypothetical protein